MFRNWIGVGFILFGSALMYSALMYKRRVLAARADAQARGLVPPVGPQLKSLGTFGEIVRPIIFFFMAVATVKTLFGYYAFDGNQAFSYLDLGGVLYTFAAYCVFVSLKTSYRLSDLDHWITADQAAAAIAAAERPVERVEAPSTAPALAEPTKKPAPALAAFDPAI